MIPCSSEHAEQCALFDWAARMESHYPELRLLFAIPNGGARHPAVAKKLKAEGVRAGVSDIMLPVARGDAHGLFIELKAAGGRATDKQKQWIYDVQQEGYHAFIEYGWQAAAVTILQYLTGKLHHWHNGRLIPVL